MRTLSTFKVLVISSNGLAETNTISASLPLSMVPAFSAKASAAFFVAVCKASKGVKFNLKTSKKMATKLNAILTKSPFEKLLSFIELLEELSTCKEIETLTSEGFTPTLNVKSNYRIEKVYDYVQENYDKKIKLQDVSNLVSMGDEAFCRFFKKSLNKSFFTFVNEYRVNLACKYLIETNRQVSQIAYDCGYESLPFFYRQFQKFMGCSPLQFKKMY